MASGTSMLIILLAVCGFSVAVLVSLCDRSERGTASQSLSATACPQCVVPCDAESPFHYGKIAPPVELSLRVAEPTYPGVPVVLIVSVSSQVPIDSGALTLRVPETATASTRTEVLWAGDLPAGVAETMEYAIGVLPAGQYSFAAVVEFMPQEGAEEAAFSAALYLDVRPTAILWSNVSFEHIKRVELRHELEHRILAGLEPELAVASEEAVADALAQLEAIDPGFIDRKIEELKATDPDVAQRIMELNEHEAASLRPGEGDRHGRYE